MEVERIRIMRQKYRSRKNTKSTDEGGKNLVLSIVAALQELQHLGASRASNLEIACDSARHFDCDFGRHDWRTSAHGELTHLIIQCFFAVYRELGAGFSERVYQRALRIALIEAQLRVGYNVEITEGHGSRVVNVRTRARRNGARVRQPAVPIRWRLSLEITTGFVPCASVFSVTTRCCKASPVVSALDEGSVGRSR
jgi:hypothetical protein